MIEVLLTNAEAKVLAYLLRTAAEEFANHGCNDIELREELGLTEDEAYSVLVQEATECYGADHPKRGPKMYGNDSALMSVFAKRIDPR